MRNGLNWHTVIRTNLLTAPASSTTIPYMAQQRFDETLFEIQKRVSRHVTQRPAFFNYSLVPNRHWWTCNNAPSSPLHYLSLKIIITYTCRLYSTLKKSTYKNVPTLTTNYVQIFSENLFCAKFKAIKYCTKYLNKIFVKT